MEGKNVISKQKLYCMNFVSSYSKTNIRTESR